jgi:type VI secretion system protein VasD
MSDGISLLQFRRLSLRNLSVCLILSLTLTACAGSPTDYLTGLGKAVLGMQAAPADPNQKIDVALTIFAGTNLNEIDKQPVSASGRVYYLKSLDTWSGMNPTQLMADDAVQKLGTALVDSREITLTPDSKMANTEKVPADAEYIGVAVFFYNAAPYRWHYAFAVNDVRNTGIVLGAHSCALTVSRGEITPLPNAVPHDPTSLAFVQCVSPL